MGTRSHIDACCLASAASPVKSPNIRNDQIFVTLKKRKAIELKNSIGISQLVLIKSVGINTDEKMMYNEPANIDASLLIFEIKREIKSDISGTTKRVVIRWTENILSETIIMDSK